MNRNQKIALGCGGAGCLGLIVVVIAGGAIFLFTYRDSFSTNRAYNSNVSRANGNYNSNSNVNDNSSNSNSSSTSTPASSLTDDDKHKLYQAATQTGDAELVRRVSVKLGLLNEDFTTGDAYEQFLVEHVTWTFRNTDFISSLNTTEKARAYVDAHIPD